MSKTLIRKTPRRSPLERNLELQLKRFNLPFEIEYKFHPMRKWRFDFAFPELKLAIEAEGGIYTNGRHTRANGFEADCEKYNHAVLLGWHVLRFTSKQIARGEALSIIGEFLSKH